MIQVDIQKTPKPILRDILRKVIAGIAAHYSTTSSLVLNGVTITPSDLTKLIQSEIDALDAADALGRKWHDAVLAAKDKSATTRPILQALESLAVSQFGSSVQALGDFGFTPRKKSKVSVDTKAGAKSKAAATRKLLGPVGTKQRKAKASQPAPTVQASTLGGGSHPA